MPLMKAYKILFILVFVLFFRENTFAEMKIWQIAREYSSSVVTIVSLNEDDQPLSLGSGFFVNDKGDIVTNYHVLEGSAKAIIKTLEGEKGEIIEIIKYDPDLDLLIAKTSFKNKVPVSFGDSDIITVGEEIVAIGNPEGLAGTVSKGIISGIRKEDGIKLIQITASISPGSSGGPVFNLSGKVIGVATGSLNHGQNLNFAMPVNYLDSLESSNIKLSSLPKIKNSVISRNDHDLAKVFDLQTNTCTITNLCSINFVIKNNGNYPIRKIKLFFVYKNPNGEVISYSTRKFNRRILPKLALQFHHAHMVRDWKRYNRDRRVYEEGDVEIRVLDYEIDRSRKNSPADLLFK